jgi:hypothetical protein
LGLFGRLDSGAVVSNVGLEALDIVGTGSYVGGLTGYNYGRIIASHSTGSVTGAGTEIGGLAGENVGSITASYSTSTVTGAQDDADASADYDAIMIAIRGPHTYAPGSLVGGLVGTNYGSITTSYSSSTVSAAGECVGGLVGYHNGSILASYCTGAVSGESYRVGGLVGYELWGDVVSSFWDVETSGQTESDGGTGLTTAEMQTAATFLDAGWDLADETLNGTCDYWRMSAGEYPRLCYAGGEGPVMPEGLGTSEEPYLIRDARDLGTVWFRPAAYYRLESSVDLSGTVWAMAVVPWFAGTFDGNSYVIHNMHIQGREYLGLFGQSGSKAVIANMCLEAVDVNGTGEYVSALVGCNGGIVRASSSSGTIHGSYYVGGLVGHNLGVVITSYSAGTIAGTNRVGGLIGCNDGGVMTSCSTGTTVGTRYVGGLVGHNYSSGKITTSYSTGVVVGDQYVGGLAGDSWGRVDTSYSTGPVTGNSRVGGLLGSALYNDRVTASFWDVETSGQSTSDGGTGLTTAEMQTAATFLDAGWDFVEIWTICEGVDYPRLQWENVECEDGL